MGDPIEGHKFEDSPDQKRFSENIVNEYQKEKSTFKKYDLRHYSQIETVFDREQIASMLKKLEVPIKDTKVTIVGGYTGQFSVSLRDIGMKVVFTDPIEAWVKKATTLGFESFQYSAVQIPESLIEKTDLFASFECYPVFGGANLTNLRFLTAEYGILFGESKLTRDEMKGANPHFRGLKAVFGLFNAIYAANCKFANKGNLRLYHIWLEEPFRSFAKLDCKFIKELLDFAKNKNEKPAFLGSGEMKYYVEKFRIPENLVLRSLKRIYQVNHDEMDDYDKFYIFSRLFEISPEVYELLRKRLITP